MESYQRENMDISSLLKTRKELCVFLLVVMVFMNYVVTRTLFAVHLFPSPQVLNISHMATNVLSLWLGRQWRLVVFPPLNKIQARLLLPLSLICCGRILIFSARVNFHFPVVSLFRQVVAMMTHYVSGFIPPVQEASVAAMMFGACVSTLAQSWSWFTYVILILDNAFLAANIIYLENILNREVIGICGLLYYDSLFRMSPAVVAAWFTNAMKRTAYYFYNYDSYFACHYFMSCVFSFVYSLCLLLSLKHTGALTTVVVGVLADVLLNYIEWMITNGFQAFHWLSIGGLIISTCGSFIYLYATFERKFDYKHDWIIENV